MQRFPGGNLYFLRARARFFARPFHVHVFLLT